MVEQAKTIRGYGKYWAYFDALHERDNFLSVSRGEKAFESRYGYPILEMLRVAKLSMDQRRKLVKPGKLQALETQLTAALNRATVVEIANSTECNVLNDLLSKGQITETVYAERNALRMRVYDARVREAATATAEWMSLVVRLTTAAKRGRPRQSEMPSEADLRDRQVILRAAASVRHNVDATPLEQILAALPKALDESLDLFPEAGDPDVPWRKRAIHLERLRRRAKGHFDGI